MLGVLKRRWKPKRASNNNNNHNNQNGRLLETSTLGEGRVSARQIHPVYGEKAQLLAYETQSRDRERLESPVAPPPAPHIPLPYLSIPPPAVPSPPPTYPLTPNICVEGGRIEFIRPSIDGVGIAVEDKHRATLGVAVSTSPPHQPQTATSILSCSGTVSRGQQTLPFENADRCSNHSDEKCDLAKESLEARVAELEALLEMERRSCQREKTAVLRLQRQLTKREAAQREAAQRDVDRERLSAAEAERCRARLAALQRDLTRMEEALRCMLQYKSRCAQLKQDKAALAAAYEERVQQFQLAVSNLENENEALRKQVQKMDAQGGGVMHKALLERLRTLETDNCLLSRDAEQQRKQYERCLDDVANQVVRALLSQKGLREEIAALQQRIRELEAHNRALTALLVQQSKQSESTEIVSKPRLRRHRTLVPRATPGADDLALLTALANIARRPHSLDLSQTSHRQQDDADAGEERATEVECSEPEHVDVEEAVKDAPPRPVEEAPSWGQRPPHTGAEEAAGPPVQEEEDTSSPESGNRDEGYSTMSSDVQVEAVRLGETLPSTGAAPAVLEEVKEATDETETLTVESCHDRQVARRVLLLDLALSTRHSFPPAKNFFPYQHIMRSFSDSHLSLKLTAAAYASNPTVTSPMLVLDLIEKPLQRTRATTSLLAAGAGAGVGVPDEQEDRLSASDTWSSGPDAVAEGCWWDTDYVQVRYNTTITVNRSEFVQLRHWLRLDDSCSALQQQHREALELEYDQSELEDWSLSLSCEDLAGAPLAFWKRGAGPSPATVSLLAQDMIAPNALPSIQETMNPELEEDSSECLWNIEGSSPGSSEHMRPDKSWLDIMNSSMAVNATSPGGSWSSAGTGTDCCGSNDCCFNEEDHSSKRSSAALSGCSDDCVSGESPTVGTDFTRDFYRLVKFESTKSLASNSSRSVSDCVISPALPTAAASDREQALQSVLNFIAEQQRYCHSREEQDSLNDPDSRPVSYAMDDEVKSATEAEEYCADQLSSSMEMPIETKDTTVIQDVDGNPDERSPVNHSNEQWETRVNTPDVVGDILVISSERAVDNLVLSSIGDLPKPCDNIPRCVPIREGTLRTVMEEEELETSVTSVGESFTSSISSPDTIVSRSSAVLVQESRVSFREHATSKDVIDELNRMIRKEEEAEVPTEAGATNIDAGCCCPTGWVHVESDIDFTDPKARANLLDVMLASSGSSGSMSSSSSDSGDEPARGDYRHLHRLHRLNRFRRHKKTSAWEPFGVLRFPSSFYFRPSIIGRDDFFVRYGDKEREAMSSFDFLDDMSTASISGASSTLDNSLPDDGRATPVPQCPLTLVVNDGHLSLSDSCAGSLSGSVGSLDGNIPSEHASQRQTLV